ncbi:MAG: folate-binding protein YgfZ [Elusimicrobia bacterium]|nr:folate-binding protein YgfZ [Elusimicrobiota bacterium]
MEGIQAWDLSDWTVLRIHGPDRKAFLNGLLSNDVKALKPGRGQLGCILTPKGLLRGDFELYDRGEDLLALARPQAGANLKEDLEKKLMLSQSGLEPVQGRALLYLAGSEVSGWLSRALEIPELPRWSWMRAGDVEIMAQKRFHEQGHWIFGRPQDVRRLLEPVRSASPAELDALRIEKGVAFFGRDIDEETIPLEARLEEAISFDKGCYMGQETIARIRYRGHVNRALVGLRLAAGAAPVEGAPVFREGENAGRLGSVAFSPRLKLAIALALVRSSAGEPGTELALSEDGSAKARVEALPLA